MQPSNVRASARKGEALDEGRRLGPADPSFERYTRAFQSLDVHAAASFFDTPALMISPPGVLHLPNAAAVEQMYPARILVAIVHDPNADSAIRQV